MSLRGPVITLKASAEGASLMGWGGVENQKCPLIFFILCRSIDKLYSYLYMFSAEVFIRRILKIILRD